MKIYGLKKMPDSENLYYLLSDPDIFVYFDDGTNTITINGYKNEEYKFIHYTSKEIYERCKYKKIEKYVRKLPIAKIEGRWIKIKENKENDLWYIYDVLNNEDGIKVVGFYGIFCIRCKNEFQVSIYKNSCDNVIGTIKKFNKRKEALKYVGELKNKINKRLITVFEIRDGYTLFLKYGFEEL